jgi:hypothetical protein
MKLPTVCLAYLGLIVEVMEEMEVAQEVVMQAAAQEEAAEVKNSQHVLGWGRQRDNVPRRVQMASA